MGWIRNNYITPFIYKKQQSLNHIVKALLFSINKLKESNYSAP
jgi:hypothetical protein